MRVLYTLLIGIPYCLLMVSFGLILCCTIVGLPAGLTMIALGFKGLTLQPRPKVVAR